LTTDKETKRAKRAIALASQFTLDKWLSPTSRALPSCFNDPGVPLRSTPGFTLAPAFAGLKGNGPRTNRAPAGAKPIEVCPGRGFAAPRLREQNRCLPTADAVGYRSCAALRLLAPDGTFPIL